MHTSAHLLTMLGRPHASLVTMACKRLQHNTTCLLSNSRAWLHSGNRRGKCLINTSPTEVCNLGQRPDVEATVVDLQLVALVPLHHHMLVPPMPLKLASLHINTAATGTAVTTLPESCATHAMGKQSEQVQGCQWTPLCQHLIPCNLPTSRTQIGFQQTATCVFWVRLDPRQAQPDCHICF